MIYPKHRVFNVIISINKVNRSLNCSRKAWSKVFLLCQYCLSEFLNSAKQDLKIYFWCSDRQQGCRKLFRLAGQIPEKGHPERWGRIVGSGGESCKWGILPSSVIIIFVLISAQSKRQKFDALLHPPPGQFFFLLKLKLICMFMTTFFIVEGHPLPPPSQRAGVAQWFTVPAVSAKTHCLV